MTLGSVSMCALHIVQEAELTVCLKSLIPSKEENIKRKQKVQNDLLALVCGVCCEFVTFPLVSWVRFGTKSYRFLIFAPLLTFIHDCN